MRQSGERLERWRAAKGETGTCGAYGGEKREVRQEWRTSACGRVHRVVMFLQSAIGEGVQGWQRLIWRPWGEEGRGRAMRLM